MVPAAEVWCVTEMRLEGARAQATQAENRGCYPEGSGEPVWVQGGERKRERQGEEQLEIWAALHLLRSYHVAGVVLRPLWWGPHFPLLELLQGNWYNRPV